MTYKIPVPMMCAPDKVEKDERVIKLRKWLAGKVEDERRAWNIKGQGHKVKFVNIGSAYPVFIIKNIFLANAFMMHITNAKTWR